MRGAASPICALATILACSSARPSRADACLSTAGTPSTVSSVAPRLELRLADGRLVRLAGLEAAAATPTTPHRGELAVSALQAMLAGRAASITVLTPKPDRWGRQAVSASVTDGPAARAGGVAAAALAAGLARYLPESAAGPCRTALIAAEDEARRARLGLWSDPYYSVLASDDRTAFAERAGSNVVVEGRLIAVEPGPYRTRLRLAASGAAIEAEARGGRRLEATIVPRAMKQFEAHGVDPTSLIGRTLRLRGLLDVRFGPRIELTSPDEIEVLPDAPAGRPN